MIILFQKNDDVTYKRKISIFIAIVVQRFRGSEKALTR